MKSTGASLSQSHSAATSAGRLLRPFPSKFAGTRLLIAAAAAAHLAGCTLYSDVSITPQLLSPKKIHRGSDLRDMLRIGDFNRAVNLAAVVSQQVKPSVTDLAALGGAELAAGRLDEARSHLRLALDLRPRREHAAEICWSLSQTEYLANNFASALEWANAASERGLLVAQWHIEFLTALSSVKVYDLPGKTSARVPLRSILPNVPRVIAHVNGSDPVDAIIDSGAVLSIVSESLATRLSLKSLGNFTGTFHGLLGEPIRVRFAIAESLQIGEMVIRNVPVAVMEDEKLSFVVKNRAPFKMDLLLGANLLKEFRLELDFARARASFAWLPPDARRPVRDQNLFFQNLRPVVHTTINGEGWFLFLLDTGSEITFLNDAQLKTANVRGSPKFHDALLQGLGGARKMGGKVANIQIGVGAWAGDFKTLPLFSAEQANAMGILGENFLQKFRVVLDFGSMQLELHRDRPALGLAIPQEISTAR